MDHPEVDGLKIAAPPVQFDSQQAALRRPAPRIGEHSAEILAEVGYSPAEISELLASRVVSQSRSPCRLPIHQAPTWSIRAIDILDRGRSHDRPLHLAERRETWIWASRARSSFFTGGSKGMGRIAAQMLAAEGCKVAIVARTKDRHRRRRQRDHGEPAAPPSGSPPTSAERSDVSGRRRAGDPRSSARRSIVIGQTLFNQPGRLRRHHRPRGVRRLVPQPTR